MADVVRAVMGDIFSDVSGNILNDAVWNAFRASARAKWIGKLNRKTLIGKGCNSSRRRQSIQAI
jgi:hypothetical protein